MTNSVSQRDSARVGIKQALKNVAELDNHGCMCKLEITSLFKGGA